MFDELSPAQRAVMLVYIDTHDYQCTADELGLSYEVVKSRVHRAINKIREKGYLDAYKDYWIKSYTVSNEGYDADEDDEQYISSTVRIMPEDEEDTFK